jgi:hypothetical protein
MVYDNVNSLFFFQSTPSYIFNKDTMGKKEKPVSMRFGLEDRYAPGGFFPVHFIMRILKSSDKRTEKWKLSLESNIFMALVRRLWHYLSFLSRFDRSGSIFQSRS